MGVRSAFWNAIGPMSSLLMFSLNSHRTLSGEGKDIMRKKQERNGIESVPPDDGRLQGCEKDLLDNDDPVAMIEASISGEGNSRSGTGVSGKHKKKNKKITLMSTNARRGA